VNDSDAFVLADHAIHVWGFGLELNADDAQRVAAHLSPDERTRAAAFHFERDRSHFSAARGRLRELLAGYLACAPAVLQFAQGAQGKPRLVGTPGAGDLRFNVSHSHGQALIAVTRGAEVGVDLEQIRPEVDAAGIVASHFSPAECAAWQALPEARRQLAFFHGWVRKEAYAKARGEGLSHDPSRYTVELAPDASGRLLADEITPDAPAIWRIETLLAPTGYAAAIAYAGSERTVEVRVGGGARYP
jgi:4'-phosphopantetheinyl transferase